MRSMLPSKGPLLADVTPYVGFVRRKVRADSCKPQAGTSSKKGLPNLGVQSYLESLRPTHHTSHRYVMTRPLPRIEGTGYPIQIHDLFR